jgi:hypothetical protein
MTELPVVSQRRSQLSRKASWALFAAGAATIVLAHLAIQVTALMLFGSVGSRTHLAWHAITLAGIALAWLALYWRRYLLSYCLTLLVLFDTVFGTARPCWLDMGCSRAIHLDASIG